MVLPPESQLRTAVWAVILATGMLAAAPLARGAAAETTGDDVVVSIPIESPRQRVATRVRVLTPKRMRDEDHWPIIYVLPVEAGDGDRWGDPLREVQERQLTSKLDVIWAFPTFADLPWYADHPTNPRLQQESYFLKDAVPRVESRYGGPRKPKDRLLLGFSKSGWGAWTLLLRNPEMFGRAAAWDAPMMMSAPGKYGSGPIFGGPDNFRHYQITRLLEKRSLKDPTRLILSNEGNFAQEHRDLEAWMKKRGLPLTVLNGKKLAHSWHSGWLAPTAEHLVRPQKVRISADAR